MRVRATGHGKFFVAGEFPALGLRRLPGEKVVDAEPEVDAGRPMAIIVAMAEV